MTHNSMEIQGMDFEAGTGRGPHEHAQCAYILCRDQRWAGGLKGCRTELLLQKY